jgi:DNA-binding NarL/FixJ family response regulator
MATTAIDLVTLGAQLRESMKDKASLPLRRALDGIGLTKVIRDRWPPINIVFVTANIDNPDIPEGMQVFSKPFHPDIFAAAVRGILGVAPNHSDVLSAL